MPKAVPQWPVQMLDVELSQGLPSVHTAVSGKAERAVSLVRLHGQPLGMVDLALGEDGLSAAYHARQVWQALHVEIGRHLALDALPPVARLDETGIPSTETPGCLRDREQLLAHAPFVSVIVPTCDRPVALAACLFSLMLLEYPNFEIIVVDNALQTSADADLGTRLCQETPVVRWIREERRGSSSARNLGLKVARGEFVAFVDDDVVVDRHWLAELVKGFSLADNVAAVTGLVVPLELQTRAQVWFELYRGFGKGFTRRLFDATENRSKNPLFPYAAAMFGSGNSMAFRTSVLRQLGGFNPILGAGVRTHGGEDLAVFYRIIAHCYRLVYEPAALVRHAHRRDDIDVYEQIHAYGVGLTAYLTSIVMDNPKILGRLAARGPAGMAYFRRSRPASLQKKRAGYPRELTRVELRGMLYGPLAYLRSYATDAVTWWPPRLPLSGSGSRGPHASPGNTQLK